MAQIPTSGPLVAIANHPFGGIEGVIMGAMLSRIRPDVRIMGNYLFLLEFGSKGLYTNTLFRFKPELLHCLTHAIEFGRSFIRSEYQKKFNSLILICGTPILDC